MLMLSLVAGEVQEISPKALMMIGAACLLIGLWFSVAVVNEKIRAFVHWGEDGSGPVMSRLGASAAAITAYLFAVLLFADAFNWTSVRDVVFWLVFGAIFFAVLISFRDYARSRKRI
jgi:hypothetical protein